MSRAKHHAPPVEPLKNIVFVRLDESVATGIEGFYLPANTDKWTAKDNAIQSMNRGQVAYVGPDCYGVEPGDFIRFSELQYPVTEYRGERFVVIHDTDIVGVEEEGSFA